MPLHKPGFVNITKARKRRYRQKARILTPIRISTTPPKISALLSSQVPLLLPFCTTTCYNSFTLNKLKIAHVLPSMNYSLIGKLG